MAEDKKMDPKLLEDIISNLTNIMHASNNKIEFNGKDYLPEKLIEHIREGTKIGLDYYNMCLKYRKNAANFKPR